MKLAKTTNDRYDANSFDILITNPLNAIYAKGTIGPELKLIEGDARREMLRAYYAAEKDAELIPRCAADWRFCDPQDIAEDGFVPRTPTVLMQDDPNWKPLSFLEGVLLQLVEQERTKRRQARQTRTRRS